MTLQDIRKSIRDALMAGIAELDSHGDDGGAYEELRRRVDAIEQEITVAIRADKIDRC